MFIIFPDLTTCSEAKSKISDLLIPMGGGLRPDMRRGLGNPLNGHFRDVSLTMHPLVLRKSWHAAAPDNDDFQKRQTLFVWCVRVCVCGGVYV